MGLSAGEFAYCKHKNSKKIGSEYSDTVNQVTILWCGSCGAFGKDRFNANWEQPTYTIFEPTNLS